MAERLATLKIRERIRTLVAFRLEAVAHIDEAVRRALAVMAQPQNARRALQIADRAYVMDSGEIIMTGVGRDMLDDPKVRAAYLGE